MGLLLFKVPGLRQIKMNMLTLKLSFIMVTFFLLQNFNRNAQSISTDSLVNIFIREQQIKYNIPAIAVAVISNGHIIKASGYGHINLDNTIPAKPTSISSIFPTFLVFCGSLPLMTIYYKIARSSQKRKSYEKTSNFIFYANYRFNVYCSGQFNPQT